MTIGSLEDLALIPAAYRRSRLVKRTLVCFFTRQVLFHGLDSIAGGD